MPLKTDTSGQYFFLSLKNDTTPEETTVYQGTLSSDRTRLNGEKTTTNNGHISSYIGELLVNFDTVETPIISYPSTPSNAKFIKKSCFSSSIEETMEGIFVDGLPAGPCVYTREEISPDGSISKIIKKATFHGSTIIGSCNLKETLRTNTTIDEFSYEGDEDFQRGSTCHGSATLVRRDLPNNHVTLSQQFHGALQVDSQKIRSYFPIYGELTIETEHIKNTYQGQFLTALDGKSYLHNLLTGADKTTHETCIKDHLLIRKTGFFYQGHLQLGTTYYEIKKPHAYFICIAGEYVDSPLLSRLFCQYNPETQQIIVLGDISIHQTNWYEIKLKNRSIHTITSMTTKDSHTVTFTYTEPLRHDDNHTTVPYVILPPNKYTTVNWTMYCNDTQLFCTDAQKNTRDILPEDEQRWMNIEHILQTMSLIEKRDLPYKKPFRFNGYAIQLATSDTGEILTTYSFDADPKTHETVFGHIEKITWPHPDNKETFTHLYEKGRFLGGEQFAPADLVLVDGAHEREDETGVVTYRKSFVTPTSNAPSVHARHTLQETIVQALYLHNRRQQYGEKVFYDGKLHSSVSHDTLTDPIFGTITLYCESSTNTSDCLCCIKMEDTGKIIAIKNAEDGTRHTLWYEITISDQKLCAITAVSNTDSPFTVTPTSSLISKTTLSIHHNLFYPPIPTRKLWCISLQEETRLTYTTSTNQTPHTLDAEKNHLWHQIEHSLMAMDLINEWFVASKPTKKQTTTQLPQGTPTIDPELDALINNWGKKKSSNAPPKAKLPAAASTKNRQKNSKAPPIMRSTSEKKDAPPAATTSPMQPIVAPIHHPPPAPIGDDDLKTAFPPGSPTLSRFSMFSPLKPGEVESPLMRPSPIPRCWADL